MWVSSNLWPLLSDALAMSTVSKLFGRCCNTRLRRFMRATRHICFFNHFRGWHRSLKQECAQDPLIHKCSLWSTLIHECLLSHFFVYQRVFWGQGGCLPFFGAALCRTRAGCTSPPAASWTSLSSGLSGSKADLGTCWFHLLTS